MSKEIKNQYEPDYVSPPGDTIAEIIEYIGMSQAELARRMGRPTKTINEIIQAKTAITPETALQLERALRMPASFWTNLERNYRVTLARLEEKERLAQHLAWTKQFPVRAMINLGWIAKKPTPVEQLMELLTFFGIASPELWEQLWGNPQVAYRRSKIFGSQPGAVSAWLRKGELGAQWIPCVPYDAHGFKALLQRIRALTRQQPAHYLTELPKLCAQVGVAVVYTPTLPKAPISGATRWLTPDKALLQLSFRYKCDDTFWFSFFHESGHILKHGKREVFIEGISTDDMEREADEFAQEMLLPRHTYQQFLTQAPFTQAKIEQVASNTGIAPGIVVGRLQKSGQLPQSSLNGLKQSVGEGMMVSGAQ